MLAASSAGVPSDSVTSRVRSRSAAARDAPCSSSPAKASEATVSEMKPMSGSWRWLTFGGVRRGT